MSVASDRALLFFFVMIRRPPRSTLDRSSAASDVYKRQDLIDAGGDAGHLRDGDHDGGVEKELHRDGVTRDLSLIHISEPTRPY